MRYLLFLFLLSAPCAFGQGQTQEEIDLLQTQIKANEAAERLARLEARVALLEEENARLKKQVQVQGTAIVQIMDENPALARRITDKLAQAGKIEAPREEPAPSEKDLSMKPALDKLRSDARAGDRKAAEKLDYLAKNPAFARTLYGDAWDQ